MVYILFRVLSRTLYFLEATLSTHKYPSYLFIVRMVITVVIMAKDLLRSDINPHMYELDNLLSIEMYL